MMTDTETQLEKFKQFLIDEERAAATIEKYRRDVQAFFTWLPEKTEVSKEMVLEYKRKLAAQYKSTSANSMLVALNRFFGFCGRRDLQVRLLKVQRVSFRERSREMSVEEYKRLVRAAREKKDERLSLLIQTLCSTGIRVSEHRCITVEALRSGSICIDGKDLAGFLPKKLQKQLKHYCKERKITTGPVFITKSGKPLNRCNIWAEMKALCKNAGIEPQKVFPHNLRHLFALTYYRLEKDIVRLADILGHANIETTRIYTSTTEEECLRSLSRMKLLL